MCIDKHEYLLRIEGVNLDKTLADTTQLSVIRGGSMLFRKAARELKSFLAEKYSDITFKSISMGASIGLFEFEAPSWKAKFVRDVAARYLSRNDPFRHLTFVVDVQPFAENFKMARESVIARNRFRQMQQLTVPLSEIAKGSTAPCAWDGLRPATVRAEATGTPWVSSSANARFKFGKKWRSKFFAEETGDPEIAKPHFTHDFEELAGSAKDRALENKLAVIYFDGNGFGKRQDLCQATGDLQEFDKTIQQYRSNYLNGFLKAIKNDQGFLFTKNAIGSKNQLPEGGQGDGDAVGKTEPPALRLELLLWGGDEILMVVPAWQGFRTLQFFYQQSASWRWRGERLTHAGALIFCNAKTPIDRMTALARELTQMVKESPEGRDRDLFDYVVLESIDFPAEPLWKFWLKRYGDLADRRTPLRPAGLSEWKAAIEALQKMRQQEEIPRSRLEPAVQKLVVVPRGGDAKLHEARMGLNEVLEGTADDHEWSASIRAQLKNLFPAQDECWLWLHLIELWDYLLPWQEQEAALGGADEKQNA